MNIMKLGRLIWNVLGVSMAFVNRTSNELGRIFEQVTLFNSTTGYSSVISGIKVRSKSLVIGNLGSNGQYISFSFEASAVTGTNLDIALMGADKDGGTKYLLLDAIVADITDTTKITGIIDIQLYPAPFYYIRIITDADETSNTLDINISGDLGGSE